MSSARHAFLLGVLLTDSVVAVERAAYVVPVVTAKVKDRVYSTTLALRNDSHQDVDCEAIYALPNDPKGGTLRSRYTVPRGGRPRVEEDVLMEVGAVGTMRIVCSGRLAIAARVQASEDGGRTFDEGRTFAALDEGKSFKRLRTLTARGDLLVAEIAGKAMTFETVVKAGDGAIIGRKTYDVPPFAQQIVNLSKLRELAAELKVELHVRSGDGALVAGDETRDPALLAMAVRMTPEARRAFHEHTARQSAAASAAETASPSITEQLLISPFKGAPFREPATGLVLMRDRWYDPSTGTFLTPDPEGYGDSSNLYAFGKGDPVNNSDPTGRYIEERDILNSPLRNRYIGWRDEFRATPLGRQWWDAVHNSTTFTLHMRPLQVQRGDNRGAVATRFYDQAGNYTSATIEFSPRFGTTAPDPSPAAQQFYRRGFEVWNSLAFGREPYRVYSFGHEFGHVLWGFDRAPVIPPLAQADMARLLNAYSDYSAYVGAQIQALRRIANPSAQQQQQLAFFLQESQRLQQHQPAWQHMTESYGDVIGYEFYRSWLQQNRPRRFTGQAPQLPPTIRVPQ